MSATSPPTNAASYLPPPPQAVANSPTAQQQMDAGNAQFNALLKLIGGRSRVGRNRCSRSRSKRSRRHKSLRRSRTRTRRRNTHRRHLQRHRRRFGGTTTTALALNPQKIEVSTVPDKGGAPVSYPSATDMQVKLAATISQNGANAVLDGTGNK